MALVECPDCQGRISSEALVCPKCGRPTGKNAPLYPSAHKILLLWVALIVAFLAIWRFLDDTAPR